MPPVFCRKSSLPPRTVEQMLASDKYLVRILPAGRNDRVAEISLIAGGVLKYIYCRRRLGNRALGLDDQILQDFNSLEADQFKAKYEIPESPEAA